MSISIVNALLGISFLTAFILSTVLFFKAEKKEKSSVFLAVATYAVAAWILAEIIFRNTLSQFIGNIAAKILHICGLAVISFFVFFCFSFLGKKLVNNKRLLFVIFGTLFIFSILTLFTGFIVARSAIIANGENQIVFGPLYPLYAGYMILATLWGYFYLYKKSIKNLADLEKVQLAYIGTGTIIAISICLVFNIVLPFWGYFNYYWLGPILAAIFAVSTTLAILRHHLFDIKVISTELFSAFISILVLVDALLSTTTVELVLKLGLFVGVCVISFLIIRSVLNEIKTREKIAKISEDLRVANVELKRLDKAKSEFLSIASHQLRTPLTAIKGYSSMLLDGEYGPIPEKPQKVIEKVFLSSRRLASIVDDFLDISKIEEGRMKYDITTFNLRETVKNVVDDFVTNSKKAKSLNLQFMWEDADFKIKSDQNKIVQVISNIVDNALKYTLEGYVKVFLSKNNEENKFLIKVEDTGVGISKDTLERLFQKFTRAQEISKLHTDGSGLGLYVAKRIMEDLHGKIWARSKGKNKGSTFFIELPMN